MMSLASKHREILYEIRHFDWVLIDYGNSLGQITMVIRHHLMKSIKPCEMIQRIEKILMNIILLVMFLFLVPLIVTSILIIIAIIIYVVVFLIFLKVMI